MAGSARRNRRETERQCAVTRRRCAPEDLLRFAVDLDGNVVPDLKSRLPGRGVWLTASRDVLEKALSTHAFDRAFRKPVKAGSNLAEVVDGLLERDALQRLSLANKAGLVVCGFDKVNQAIRGGNVGALVHGADASEDGCRKLDRLFVATREHGGNAGTAVRSFNCEQLSLALGRPNVVHAALKQGAPVRNFLSATARLDKFRTGRADDERARVPETEVE